jgi:hypothetical protein
LVLDIDPTTAKPKTKTKEHQKEGKQQQIKETARTFRIIVPIGSFDGKRPLLPVHQDCRCYRNAAKKQKKERSRVKQSKKTR